MLLASTSTSNHSRLLQFDAARLFARSLKLPTRDAWRQWVAVRKHRATLDAQRVPSRPDIAYESCGWVDWTDWLHASGRTIRSRRFSLKPFMPVADWLDWVAAQSFRKKEEYDDWCKAHPDERKRLLIPSSPALTYADFPGWSLALGTTGTTSFKGRIAKRYLPFREARQFARSLKLYPPTAAGWRLWAREHRALLDSSQIPATPQRVAQYRREFRGWRDFLGTDRRPTVNRKR